MRIAGIDIPEHLRLEYALQSLYGIGPSKVQELLVKTHLDPNRRAKELTENEVAAIQKALEDGFVYGGELRRQIAQNISRLKNIKSYRGHRHTAGLPAHGQRTKTNARTKRGKRVTVGAFKKEEIAKTDTKQKPATEAKK